jgi:hypothetical protein
MHDVEGKLMLDRMSSESAALSPAMPERSVRTASDQAGRMKVTVEIGAEVVDMAAPES